MKAKWGALVVDGRGKLGGHVASRNTAGAYFRTKVTPVNPSTAFQETARNRFATLSSSWRDLTEEERSSWNSAVDEFAKTDVFGDLKNPTGFNLFQRLNNNLEAIGQATKDVAPKPAGVPVSIIGELIVDVGVGDAMTIAISEDVPNGTKVEIWATQALSAGISFAKSKFRLIDVKNETTGSPISFKTPYLARFGSPAVGTKVFVELKFIKKSSGQASPVQMASTLVISSV